MIVVIQRVENASVTINQNLHSIIGFGLLVLLGIAQNDMEEDADWIFGKMIALRIFGDDQGKMNLSLLDKGGEILLVSQFTLLANAKKGNRPSYTEAAKPELAIPLYEYCVQKLQNILGNKLKTGVFGADMKVALLNDGPVTIILNSKDRQ